MSIVNTELKLYKAEVHADGGTNGGRLSVNQIIDDVYQNIFPEVMLSELTSGSTKYRKAFWKVANGENRAFNSVRLFLGTQTPGNDTVVIFPGTQTDTASAITGAERLYGCGQLADATKSTGATSMQVTTEGNSFQTFRNGDLVHVSDKTRVTDLTGSEEFRTLAASYGAVYSGDSVMLVFTSGETLQYSYTGTGTKVASVYQQNTVCTSVGSPTLSSAAGSIAMGTSPIIVDNISGVEDTFTVTFTTSVAFGVSGVLTGALAAGTRAATYTSISSFGTTYFTIPTSMWAGTWMANDTLTFATHPAVLPFWMKRVIPPACPSISNNNFIPAIAGTST